MLPLPVSSRTLHATCVGFVARQKAQGTHLNWIVEQVPVAAPADYDRRFGDQTARDLVCDHVLRLTYTAHDMAPFADDLGYDGRHSFGMLSNAGTCAPVSTPSTSISTASPATMSPTSWKPFPSSAAKTKSSVAATGRAISFWPT